MLHRKLGNTGIAVSKIALGTMYFGSETSEADAFAILDTFVEAGGNLVDTADVYVGGVSEQIIGRWFAARPRDVTDRVVLASKGRFGGSPDVNAVGLSRRHLHRALNASLGRLGVETIDLFQLHASDMHTPVEETLSFLDEAVKSGKIHYIGLSNFTGWQLQLIVSTAEAMGVQVPPQRFSRNTACCPAKSSGRLSPPHFTTGLACCRGHPSRAAFSPANISVAQPRRRTLAQVPRSQFISGFQKNMPTPIAIGRQSMRLFALPGKSVRRLPKSR